MKSLAAPALASLLAFASASPGQTVGAPVVKFQGTSLVAYGEPSIAANPYDSNQAVVICNRFNFDGNFWSFGAAEYIIAKDGFHSDQVPTPFAPSVASSDCPIDGHWLDPRAAASTATGDLFLSAMSGANDSAARVVEVDRIPAGTRTPDTAIEAVHCTYPDWEEGKKDFPVLASGPWPADTHHAAPDTLYVVIDQNLPDFFVRSAHSLDQTPTGVSWAGAVADTGGPKTLDDTDPQESSVGRDLFATVLSNGRVVVAYVDPSSGITNVTSSDTQGDVAQNGTRWRPREALDHFGVGTGTQLYGGFLFGLQNNESATGGSTSLATDPTDANIVYLACTVTLDPDSISPDILIAQSTTGAVAPIPNDPASKAFPLANRILVTDAHLHAWGLGDLGQAAFHPSIAVDWLGGINLLMVRTRNDGNEQVWYLRWASFDDLKNSVAPYVFSCTPSGFQPWFYMNGLGGNGNDYLTICRAGCGLYLSYGTGEGGLRSVAVRFVAVSNVCWADMNGDGVVNATDLSLFLDKYIQGDAIADRNYDGVVDVQDVALFLNSYQP